MLLIDNNAFLIDSKQFRPLERGETGSGGQTRRPLGHPDVVDSAELLEGLLDLVPGGVFAQVADVDLEEDEVTMTTR